MKQLVLELIPAPAPSFDNYVVGANQEARNALFDAAFQVPPARVIYLWGVAGSGKSHCLNAVAVGLNQPLIARHTQDSEKPGLRVQQPPTQSTQATSKIIIVDDVQRLDDAQQVWLFNSINERATRPDSCVIVSGNVAPRDLLLRPELSSRLGSGLTFQVHPLTDDEKAVALHAHATSRGFSLRDDVTAYLLRHSRRDMASLIAMLDALDKYSLETGREITLPLLKQIAQPTLI